MEPKLFVWVELGMNAVQIAALGAVLWQLIHLRRGFQAMLRVMRRLDRKIPALASEGSTTASLAREDNGLLFPARVDEKK